MLTVRVSVRYTELINEHFCIPTDCLSVLVIINFSGGYFA